MRKGDSKEKKKNGMILSQLSVGGLTSLLVVAMLLTIFVSVISCLVNIQMPAMLHMSDKAAVVKNAVRFCFCYIL